MQTQVTIYHADGGAATRKRVSMHIQGGTWSPGTVCEEAFTNDQGVAIIEHSSSGTGEIHVDGRCVGKLKVPGSGVFRL